MSEDLLKAVRDTNLGKVKLAVTDIDGVLRGKTVHESKFQSVLESGFGFCNVIFGWDCADECYDNSQYTGWHSGYPDALARVDATSFRQVPWDQGMPFLLADFYDGEGQPLAVCPRQLLKAVREQARAQG